MDDRGSLPGGPEKKESVPPPLPGSFLNRPVGGDALNRPVSAESCARFLSVTGGSILYCLSALCVIYGVTSVLGPVFARSFSFGETVPALASLNVYEIALLAVLLLIVVWKNVTDDAISLVVIIAIFLVVSGIALTTTSNSRPRLVLEIGACCFALAMVKVYLLRRFVGMSISGVLWAGLAVVLGWNFLAGARLAEIASVKAIEIGREPWLVAWLPLLAGAIVVAVDAAMRRRERAEESIARVPFLRRPAMSWIFTLVLLVAAGVHQHSLAYVFGVSSTVFDYMPFVCVLSLIFVLLAFQFPSRPAFIEAMPASLPLVTFLIALTGYGALLEKPVVGIPLFWYAPVYLGLTGAAVLLIGIFRKNRALLVVAGAYLLGVALTLTFSTVSPEDLNWRLAGGMVGLAFLVLGIKLRSVAFCVAALFIGVTGFSMTSQCEQFAKFLGMYPFPLLLGLTGLGLLAIAIALGRMHSALLVVASLLVMAGLFGYLNAQIGMKDVAAGLLICACGAGLWARRRHWPSIAIVCSPVAWRIATAPILQSSWRFVVLGFLLLAAGAFFSIRKAKHGPPAGGGE